MPDLPATPTTIALASHRWADPLRVRTGLGRYQWSLTRALANRASFAYLRVGLHEPSESRAEVGLPDLRTLPGNRQLLQARWALTGRPRIEQVLPEVALTHVVDMTVPVPSRRPTVHTVHDLFPDTRPSWTDRRARLLFRAVLRTVRRADRVITPTRSVADQLLTRLALPADRVVVVPEGVDARFGTVPPGGDPDVLTRHGLTPDGYWLTVGRPGPRKNHEVLVRALTACSSDRPLVLVGPDGPGSVGLTELARDLGVTDRVRRLGFVDDEDLPHLLAGARALLHPARDEGFGLPPLEAMATGTPVVVAPSPAVREVTGDVALTAAPDDVASWARHMAALGDDAEREDRGRAGRRRAAGFTWEAAAAATEEVYASCLT